MSILDSKLKQESDKHIQRLLNGDFDSKIHYLKTRERTKKLFLKFVEPFSELELSEMMSVSATILGVTLYSMREMAEDDAVNQMWDSVIDSATDYAQHLKTRELQELNKQDDND